MHQMKEMKKSARIQKSFRFTPRTVELLETHKYVTNGSAVDFVTAAIANYCADIDGAKNLDILCDRIYKIFSAEVGSQANRMAHLLFKIAVELAIQNHLLAAGYVNLTDSEMRSIRNQATNTVRKSRGFLSFEAALEVERGQSED